MTLSVFATIVSSCTKDVVPTVSTSEVIEVEATSAKGGGTITLDGGAEVYERGVCWNLTEQPTILNSKSSDGTGTGQFVSLIDGLKEGSTYYLRAYATNEVGTAYGNEVTFTTLGQVPSVIIQLPTNVSTSAATLNGSVNPNYLATSITFEYGTSTNYGSTIPAAQSPISGQIISTVSAVISGLSAGTTYYFRIKAENSLGTVFSEPMSFKTSDENASNIQPCPGAPIVIDSRDGNIYNTIKIGNQCWLKENLRYLPEVSPSSIGSEINPYHYVIGYEGSSVSEAKSTINYANYGVLYNYPAAKKGCPDGWHLPKDSDWEALANFVRTDNGGYIRDGEYWFEVGKHLKASYGWPVGNGTDDYGFSGLPGGSYYWDGNNGWKFSSVGGHGQWWSDPVTLGCNLYLACILQDKNNIFIITAYSWQYAFSVRCIKD